MITTHTFQIDTDDYLQSLALIEFMAKLSGISAIDVKQLGKEISESNSDDTDEDMQEKVEKAVEKPVEKTVKKPVEKTVKKPVETQESEEQAITITNVRVMLQQKVNTGNNRELIFKMLRDKGAESITKLDPKHYEAIYEYMKQLA